MEHDIIYCSRVNHGAKFIHYDFNESEEWEAFLLKNKENVNAEFGAAHTTPLASLHATGVFHQRYIRVVPSDSKKMLFKFLNNKQFQKDVVSFQDRGGLFDYMVDMRLLKISQAL